MRYVTWDAEFLKFLRRTSVDVLEFGIVHTTTFHDDRLAGEEDWPVVRIDVSRRPDVADLFRVVQLDGLDGKHNPEIRYVPDKNVEGLLASLTIDDPVKCEFCLFLNWREQNAAPFFDLIAEKGLVCVTPHKLSELGTRLIESLMVIVDSSDLCQALAVWQAQL